VNTSSVSLRLPPSPQGEGFLFALNTTVTTCAEAHEMKLSTVFDNQDIP
jgi:hypothetical protein